MIIFFFATATANSPFQLGEKLDYTAQFNFIPAGESSLEFVSIDTLYGHPVYHIAYKANTGKVADRFFKIRDQVDMWLDKSELYTHRLSKKIREGSFIKDIDTQIDYKKHISISNNDTVHISGKVRDPYSLFYYLRTIPLSVGEVFSFLTFESNKTTELKLKVTGKEFIKTKSGDYFCFVVKPYQDGKTLLKNKGDMQIWFSDDLNRFPVQVVVKLKFGTMTMKLKKISYPKGEKNH
ncbi:MAG: DUF3108 domain-containing protein [Candidatus Marinimicrobia bacterium]|nr:DUF3108 domain-containing protein [Candidatus Neomarinimicrobiota bacterium]MBT3997637.1 DUF3108 domain-containing protein [Candidatus Neomarinimicrobiota bacterium]MBT4280935.1 DUF3108 domain-containing protein [Candidatus Neomarinimicrobiota bacterium]MBT6708931.1 DUF3108 domain-containing protein [Candidatus Neomarinimicrobiota bacterium]MBT7985674.1 DUF3108 domain-containing protein [Candidatus Neomarinimicrobiota bacterium]